MIMITKILVPTDLSATSASAIGYSACLAVQHEAEVLALHVLPVDALKPHFDAPYHGALGIPAEAPTTTGRPTDLESVLESKQQLVRTFLDQKFGSKFSSLVKLRPLIKIGKVTDEIIAAAKEEQCDLIVIASEAGGLRRLFGGSVAERLMRQAPCPVLSMRPSARVRTETDERIEVRLVDRWAA